MFHLRRPSCAGFGAAARPIGVSRSSTTSAADVVTGGMRGESIASRWNYYHRPSRCYKRACKARAYTLPLLNST